MSVHDLAALNDEQIISELKTKVHQQNECSYCPQGQCKGRECSQEFLAAEEMKKPENERKPSYCFGGCI